MRRFFEELEERLRTGQVFVATHVMPDGSVNQDFLDGGEYVSRMTYPVHLVLFGGGHIAQALSRLARMCNMAVTVIDDRKEILTRENFPHGEDLVYSPFNRLPEDLLSSISNPYCCIFTHGHGHDGECLVHCCSHPCEYIGMIGSRQKIEGCFEYARQHGIGDDALSRVHSPIGLAINAVTPAEIAVSIMAEVISVYRSERHVVVLDPELVRQIASSHDGVVCRILRADGSSPGKEGAMMLVDGDRILGTVGGGALEAKAIEEAGATTRDHIVEYRLDDTGDLGMTCGGDVTMLFSTCRA